jgi:WD40 repeat protein
MLARTCQTEQGDVVQLWDVASGQLLRTITGHASYVMTVFFSPDGSRLLTSSFDQTARVWDVNTGQELLRLAGHTSWVNYAVYSASGSKIATAGNDGLVIVWDATDGSRLFDVHTRGGAFGVSFSPDGTRLAISTEAGAIQLWDSSLSGRGELSIVTTRNLGRISANQARLIDTWGDGTVYLSDPQTFEHLAVVQTFGDSKEDEWLFSGLSYNNEWLSVASGGRVGIWRVADGVQIYGRSAQMGWSRDMDIAPVFSPNGRRLAFSGYLGSVYLLDTATWQEMTLPITLTFLQMGKFSPDGKLLAVCGSGESGGEVWVWDFSKSGETISDPKRFPADYRSTESMDFSPDGKYLAIAGIDGESEIREVVSGQVVVRLAGHTSRVFSIGYSRDGRYLVTASWDNTVKVWDAQTGAELVSYSQPNPNSFFYPYFTPDSQRVVVYGADGYYEFSFLAFDPLVELLSQRVNRNWQPEECQKYLHSETCP